MFSTGSGAIGGSTAVAYGRIALVIAVLMILYPAVSGRLHRKKLMGIMAAASAAIQRLTGIYPKTTEKENRKQGQRKYASRI